MPFDRRQPAGFGDSRREGLGGFGGGSLLDEEEFPGRYDLGFDILTSRYPFVKSAEDSRLRKIMAAIRNSLRGVTIDINAAINCRFISTSTGDALDAHGETLGLSRNPCELDADYRSRLLIAFRDIPKGLTIDQISDAVESVIGEVPEIDEYYESPCLWPVAAPAQYSKIGNSSIGPSYATCLNDQKFATRFQVDADVAAISVLAYLAGSGGDRTAYASIYADNISQPGPGAKIASALLPMTINAAGWYVFTFNGAAMIKDAYYWFCINCTGGGWRFYYDVGTVDQSAYNYDTPPSDDPFGAFSPENRAYSIYAICRSIDSAFNWNRPFNSPSSRFIAAVITRILTLQEVNDIAEVLEDKKPAHMVIRIVESTPEGLRLQREVL